MKTNDEIGASMEPLRKLAEDGWIQEGHLLYRLTDERTPKNRDEINVLMADGSRTEEARTRRAGELLDAIRAAAPQAVQAAVPTIAELEASAELGALRDVYEMARGVLRFDGIDMERALKYKDGLIEAIETVKTIDGGTWEPAHPAEGVPAQAGAYAEARECEHCNHVGINDTANGIASCTACKWNGDSPKEDKCPDCEAEGTMTASCPKCHHEYRLIADATLAATQPAAQGMDALTIVEKLPRYTYGYKSDEWGMNRCLRAYQDNAGTFLMRDEVLAALAAQAKQGGAA